MQVNLHKKLKYNTYVSLGFPTPLVITTGCLACHIPTEVCQHIHTPFTTVAPLHGT